MHKPKAPREWSQPIIKAWIEPFQMKPGSEWKHQLYNVRLQETGEIIIGRSRVAEYDACRELLARGVTGTLETWWHGKAFASMRLDIEAASKRTIRESDSRGPEETPYVPFDAAKRFPSSED